MQTPIPSAPPCATSLRAFGAALLIALAACDGGGGGGGTSPPAALAPSVGLLDPAVLLEWSAETTLTVHGSGFSPLSVVRWNDTALPTSLVSAAVLTAQVPAALMQQVGIAQVSVLNPPVLGGASNRVALAVEHRVPEVQFVNPNQVQQGVGPFTLTVIGVGFATASVVRWNGVDRPTTFVDPSRLTAQISVGDVQVAGAAQATVFTPAPGGGLSAAHAVPVLPPPNPPAVATSLAPSEVVAGQRTVVTVTGTGFIAATEVGVGSYVPAVTVVSPTELRFTLEPGQMPEAGTFQVAVHNPLPGGGFAGSFPVLSVVNPVPVLTAVSPARVVAGQDSVVVRISGSGFVPGSVVRFDDLGRVVRHLSATEVEIVLDRADLSRTGTFPVSASNFGPGGGVSNTLFVEIVAPSP
jgi:hypothetical protein